MPSFRYSSKRDQGLQYMDDDDDDVEIPAQREQQQQPVDVTDLSHDFPSKGEGEIESTDDDDDDTDDNSSNKKNALTTFNKMSQPGSRYFILSIASNLLFVIASCFYLALAGRELEYNIQIQDLSDDVIQADDDATWTMEAPFVGDDYVFSATKSQVWVSHYQILYFAGAMCFVWSGALDMIKEPGWLGIVLVMAGCFGLTSAMLVEKNEHMSNIFNSVSVHLFLVEATGLFFQRGAAGAMFANNPTLQTYVRLGDAFFILGTLIDVVLSYYYVLGTDRLIHAQMAVLAATLWLACSLIYITATSHVECQGRKQYQLRQPSEPQQQQQQVAAKSTETPSTQGGDNYMYDDDNDQE